MIRRTVPLALGLLSVSNPQITVMDTLSKLSHDHDADVAQGAIFALGLIGAGMSQTSDIVNLYLYCNRNQQCSCSRHAACFGAILLQRTKPPIHGAHCAGSSTHGQGHNLA